MKFYSKKSQMVPYNTGNIAGHKKKKTNINFEKYNGN